MKKLLILFLLPSAAWSQINVNTNVITLSGSGSATANGTYSWYSTGTYFSGSGCASVGYYTNAAGAFLAYYGGGWFEQDSTPCSFGPVGYNCTSFPTGWSTATDASPPPTGTYGVYPILTNWVQATSNYWTAAGDVVYLHASGRDYSIPGTALNRLCVLLDTNLVFTGPFTSGGGFPWQLSVRVQWLGTTNFAFDSQFISADTNVGTVFASGTITNSAGTNAWTWVVVGDTNSLTFDSQNISAGRAPTNGLAQYAPTAPTPLNPIIVTNNGTEGLRLTNSSAIAGVGITNGSITVVVGDTVTVGNATLAYSGLSMGNWNGAVGWQATSSQYGINSSSSAIVITSRGPAEVLTNWCIPTNCWPWTLPSGFCGYCSSNYDLYWVTPLKTNLVVVGH